MTVFTSDYNRCLQQGILASIYSNYVDILDLTAISAALWIRREVLTHCYLPQFVTTFHLTDRRYSTIERNSNKIHVYSKIHFFSQLVSTLAAVPDIF